ncbi:MAG: shikimate kinase [Bacteroidaceae bacterium]|nr:shikimate kinase [Bacteroidaceae bacterium]
MIRIFLIGYMCSGKTTLGRAFALKMGLQFIDMDWYIEGRFHKTVKQIFAELGEEAFREMERKMLHEVGDFENVMIATGGGTACFFDNVQYMNQQGQTVYMKADVDTLFSRLQIGKAKRPLLMNKTDEEMKQYITEQLAHREPFYSQATYVFDSNRLESRHQIDKSIEELRQLLGL